MKRFIILSAGILLIVSSAFGGDGNIDGIGGVDLKDVIMSLQISAGLTPTGTVNPSADVDGNKKIGLEETIYALQVIAGLRTGSDFSNNLGMSFKLIPAGTFMMGSPTTEMGRKDDETQHQVILTKSYYMQTTEVTQGQWKAVMGTNIKPYYSACGDSCPMESVSWDDAQSFIQNLNQMEATNKYRLPTEAEWEYAARAGSATAFANGGITSTGNTDYNPVDPNLNLIGWFKGNSAVTYSPNSGGIGIHPVGQKQSNAWGLFDMHGNIREWVQDCYGSYPTGAVTDPLGTITGSYRVFRGGSWYDFADGCRSAVRNYMQQYVQNACFGFRLVREQ